MRRIRTTLSVIGAVLLCIVIGIWWHLVDTDSTEYDGKPLPPLPVVPEDATPSLVSSSPLPATDRQVVAKPVIAADHEHRTVFAQDVLRGESRLVQWRFDKGEWSESQPWENWPPEARFVGDPWLESDRRGRFYLIHTSLEGGNLIVRRSKDYARTWSAPLEIAKGADRPVLGVSPSGKRLVIAASLGEIKDFPKEPLNAKDPQFKAKLAAAVSRSAGIFSSQDHGRSWKRLPGPLRETHAVPLSVIVDDDGRIASSWIAADGNSRSVVCSTIDNGQTWTETELVTKLHPDRNHPFNGQRFPVMSIGSTGVLHVAYVESLAKGLSVRRNEGWNEWSPSIRLTQDSVEEIRMPAIAALGPMVHVTWMERQGGRWQMYYRGSRDHGESWSAKLLVSVPHATSTLIDENGFDLTSDDDQSSVADDGAGIVHVVWAVRGAQPNVPGRIWHAAIEWRVPAQHRDAPR